MERIQLEASIPLLPVVSLKETEAFFEDLGFSNIYKDHKRSSGYAVMKNKFLTFHLYVYKKLVIPTPTNMTLIQVNNVDAAYNLVADSYKAKHGKLPPRSGYPKVGRPHTLTYDRRFSITDPNGNIFIVLQTNEAKQERSKENRFEKLYWESYTLLYSHESPMEAKKMMEQGFKRTSLESESPDLVFQAFVLLVDIFLILNKNESAVHYFQQAQQWSSRLSNDPSELLTETLKQYQEFEQLLK
ncbi:hypothetical protein JTF06_02140 [Desemzia sp. RIT804]|uniref:hypothetical protein n=1 Tax=Desemzia sp. RIT 804 TaxID=2810209 RepID=UPI001951423F|nr:hypothetical protein [Desemzia sp. RIT 804]MBM6613692.1 hypothetical protein [Desemzia sp. RIT 804]